MSFDFTDKTILLTGATRGIGRELTKLLIARGAYVLAVSRDEKALEDLAATAPSQIAYLAADLEDPTMPRAIANWVNAEHPECCGLINNAAIMVHTDLTAPPHDRTEELAQEIAINLTSPMALCTALLPTLSRNGPGLIANVTSGLALTPLPDAAGYCASKAGLRSFTKALRYQCEDTGFDLQVSEVLMTLVDTNLSHGDPAKKLSPAEAATDMITGLEAGTREIAINKVRLLKILVRFAPWLADRIIRGPRPKATPAE
ncbi:MAG: SDR family NAD(P)-dependent oxidoreductase [Thalassovita sp.]